MAHTVRAYEVEMVFSASVGFKQINDILRQVGCKDELQIKKALNITLTQTLAAIPDEEYLRKCAGIIKDNYETNDIYLTECHFDSYKSIREIQAEVENNGK